MHERWMLSRQKELEERVWEGEVQEALKHWREFRSRVEEATTRRQEERTANLDHHGDYVIMKSETGSKIAQGVDTTLDLAPTDLSSSAALNRQVLVEKGESVLFPTASNLKMGFPGTQDAPTTAPASSSASPTE